MWPSPGRMAGDFVQSHSETVGRGACLGSPESKGCDPLDRSSSAGQLRGHSERGWQSISYSHTVRQWGGGRFFCSLVAACQPRRVPESWILPGTGIVGQHEDGHRCLQNELREACHQCARFGGNCMQGISRFVGSGYGGEWLLGSGECRAEIMIPGCQPQRKTMTR